MKIYSCKTARCTRVAQPVIEPYRRRANHPFDGGGGLILKNNKGLASNIKRYELD